MTASKYYDDDRDDKVRDIIRDYIKSIKVPITYKFKNIDDYDSCDDDPLDDPLDEFFPELIEVETAIDLNNELDNFGVF